MTVKVNKAEFMFGKEAGELQRKLEDLTGQKWTIECVGEVLSGDENNHAPHCSRCGNGVEVFARFCSCCGCRFVRGFYRNNSLELSDLVGMLWDKVVNE